MSEGGSLGDPGMRWLVAALSALLVAGTVAAQVPGGHEAFNYWFNGTKWVETSAANPFPIGTAQGGVSVPQIGCTNSVLYDASTAGSTQLIAPVASQIVYVCGYTVFSNGTVNVELDSATVAACAGGVGKIVPAFQFQAQSGVSDNSSVYRGLRTAPGGGLCIKTSAAVAVQAIVYYAQF